MENKNLNHSPKDCVKKTVQTDSQIELHSDTSEKGSSEIRLSETMPRKKPLVWGFGTGEYGAEHALVSSPRFPLFVGGRR